MGEHDDLINSVDLTKHRHSERCGKATEALVHKGWDAESYLMTVLLAELITAEETIQHLQERIADEEVAVNAACEKLISMSISTGHADSAVELVGECITNLAELQERIEALENPWVSADDRFPDEEGVYLCMAFNPYHEATFPMVFEFLAGAWAATFHARITHWMPIPEDK